MAANLPSSRRGRGRAPMAEINVTPLVDVMLVLLIIFMVTAPLLTAGVAVDLPESKAAALDQQQEPVTVSIEANGQVSIGEEPVDAAELAARFEALAAGDPPQIFLRADRSLDYGRVMGVLGELNRAGLNKVALVSVGTERR